MMIQSEVRITLDEIEQLVKEHLEKVHSLKVFSMNPRKAHSGEFNGYNITLKSVDTPLIEKTKTKKLTSSRIMI